jgi:hypothetical protein
MDEVVLSSGTHMTRNWPVLIEQWTRSTLRDPLQHVSRRHVREDPCYGYKGYFVSANWRRGPEMRCPNCSSRPRDRLLAKLLEVSGLNLVGKRILHFAPELPLYRRLKDEAGDVGGDIIQRRNADAVVNITAIDSDDTSYDVLYLQSRLGARAKSFEGDTGTSSRVARGWNRLFLPLDASRAQTWYLPDGMSREEGEEICGWDHKRLYGRDVTSRLESSSFEVDAAESYDDRADKYRLYNEQMFVCTRLPGRFIWRGPKWN